MAFINGKTVKIVIKVGMQDDGRSRSIAPHPDDS